jgi:hypothetical protein
MMILAVLLVAMLAGPAWAQTSDAIAGPTGLGRITITVPIDLGPIGTPRALFTNIPSLRTEMALGTDAAPVGEPGAALKISKTLRILTDPPAVCTGRGIDPECGMALHVVSESLPGNTLMNVGGTFVAKGDHLMGTTGGSGDQIGVYSTGRKASGGSTVYGAFLEGRADGSGIAIRGAELQQNNQSGVARVYDATGGDGVSAWLTGQGATLLGVGAAVRAAGLTPIFQAGFVCTNISVGDHGGACHDDISEATASYRSRGQHRVGIDLSGALISGASLRLPPDGWIEVAGGGAPRFPGMRRGGGIPVCWDEATGQLFAADTATCE